ncbi:RDD family protein [Paenibacillus sp. 28ISP30-2]|uniref:RDD family protein n=1 Tax=Paenibacillus sp. 23TSA30-6 TaxID=2546104 RepID=UPI001787F694|nr:RDD family protein [Paenibacillus sp. 23TSA30-6]MBE0337707.1 RDD family protein [Paenibacillus sp. 23TSA30-6]MBE0342283.1 RDD family protein [Paenibacillus sp. 28ISP30-2]
MLYAGFWKRVLASIIDNLLMWFVFMILGLIWFVIQAIGDWGSSSAETSLLTDGSPPIFTMKMVGQTLLNWGAMWLYHAIMESSKCKASVGKLALGIVVVDEFNQKLSFGRASARHWSKFISAIILCIGFIMTAFTAQKQALHDLIARTYVVDKRELNHILREQAERGAGM